MTMFAEVGYAFGLLFVMLFLIVVFDAIAMIGVFVRKSAEVSEYASYVLNWIKIVVLFIFAIIMVYFSIIMKVSVLTKMIELVIGILLAADSIVSAVIKIRFGRKKKK